MPAPLPVGGLAFASIGLTAVVVGNAYYQKKQFYPSVVYITKSNPSMAAIYLLAFTLVILLGQLLKKVFFGQLRTAEFEQLAERTFYAITETCLAFTVFRDDFSPKFVALFTVLLFLKAFHYLTDSRVDFMERSPVITPIFHIRISSVLILLIMTDLLLLNYSYYSTITHGASVQLVFGFEYAVLVTVAFNTVVKYICHSIDLRSENPWENKAAYLLYTELLVGFTKVILYSVFVIIMIRIHTFPLFIVRPVYLTVRSFKNALNDIIQSRRAIYNMNTLYPDATTEELNSMDNVCIICREEMTAGAKKLPCSHIFHSSCLRSWFQRQQTCPTCRMDILQQNAPIYNQAVPPQMPQQQGSAAAAQQPQTTQPQQQQPPQAMPNFPPPGVFPPPFPFPMIPFNQFLQQAAALQNTTTGNKTATADKTASSSTGASAGAFPTSQGSTGSSFGSLPSLLPFMPFGIPLLPPPPPSNFEGLTMEELRKMEGTERENVEARIKALRNIHTLLDAAAVQLNQYHLVIKDIKPTTDLEATEQNEDRQNGLTNRPTEEGLGERCEVHPTTGARNKESSTAASPSDKVEPPHVTPTESISDDPDEIRRRRLEKFSGFPSEETS